MRPARRSGDQASGAGLSRDGEQAAYRAILIGVASVLYSALTARSKVNAEQIEHIEAEHAAQIEAISGQVTEAKERLALVEQAQRQMPTHSDITEVQGRISRVASGVDEMKGQMVANNRLLDNIHRVLLDRSQ